MDTIKNVCGTTKDLYPTLYLLMEWSKLQLLKY